MLSHAELMVRHEVHVLMKHNRKCKKFERFFLSTVYEIFTMAMELLIAGGCNLTEISQHSDLQGRRKIKHGLRL